MVMADAATVEWTPLEYDPQFDRAAVRLLFVKLFPRSAKSWEKEYEKPVTSVAVRDLFFDEKLHKKYRVDDRHISNLWGNPFGIPVRKDRKTQKSNSDTVRAALELADIIFPPVLDRGTSAALSGMDMVAQNGEEGTLVRLQTFRDHYQSIIDPLRELADDKKTIDVKAIIAQYDEWIAYIMDLAANGAKPENENLPTKEERAEAAKRAVKSTWALREASLHEKPSPLTDLYHYQRLSNELQSHCAEARLDPGKREVLKRKVKHEEFFKRAERFNEICNWRTQELLHALIVASSIDDRGRMKKFGLLLLEAMYLALEVALQPEKPPYNHIVFSFRNRLFIGDEAPAESTHLKTYMEKVHSHVYAQFVAERSDPGAKRLSLSCRI